MRKKRPVTKTNMIRTMAQHLRHTKDSQSPVPPSSMLRERLSSVLGLRKKRPLLFSRLCCRVVNLERRGFGGQHCANKFTEGQHGVPSNMLRGGVVFFANTGHKFACSAGLGVENVVSRPTKLQDRIVACVPINVVRGREIRRSMGPLYDLVSGR